MDNGRYFFITYPVRWIALYRVRRSHTIRMVPSDSPLPASSPYRCPGEYQVEDRIDQSLLRPQYIFSLTFHLGLSRWRICHIMLRNLSPVWVTCEHTEWGNGIYILKRYRMLNWEAQFSWLCREWPSIIDWLHSDNPSPFPLPPPRIPCKKHLLYRPFSVPRTCREWADGSRWSPEYPTMNTQSSSRCLPDYRTLHVTVALPIDFPYSMRLLYVSSEVSSWRTTWNIDWLRYGYRTPHLEQFHHRDGIEEVKAAELRPTMIKVSLSKSSFSNIFAKCFFKKQQQPNI